MISSHFRDHYVYFFSLFLRKEIGCIRVSSLSGSIKITIYVFYLPTGFFLRNFLRMASMHKLFIVANMLSLGRSVGRGVSAGSALDSYVMWPVFGQSHQATGAFFSMGTRVSNKSSSSIDLTSIEVPLKPRITFTFENPRILIQEN